ncbi:hypothetical protein [Burkholderia cenocepacia]|uniref:hypothetical protein n=1 Tax=Burkholderia cenocepacia TaxID=95486 RepID=UPI000761F634|nr:hypothetical protein [Burkholderia cenocepacia]KWU19156.1 hypothetical protein AS149_12985 [Burkholderia cenocepacia]
METKELDMYRVVFLPKLAGRDEPSVWHPTRARAEQWADYFANRGHSVAVQWGKNGKLDRWTPRSYAAIS